MTARIHLATPADAPLTRRERHRAEAATAALGVLSALTEAAQQARELVEEFQDDLPVAVTDALPRLANSIDPAVMRMGVALRNAGRVR